MIKTIAFIAIFSFTAFAYCAYPQTLKSWETTTNTQELEPIQDNHVGANQKSDPSNALYPPFYSEQENELHPYLGFGVGSIAVGIQGGLVYLSDNYGLDGRIGAGSIAFVSRASAHLNYLRFPTMLENLGDHDYFIGVGMGVCYLDVLFSGDRLYAGPNLVLGRKFHSATGKVQFQDINILFPIKAGDDLWMIPSCSVNWVF